MGAVSEIKVLFCAPTGCTSLKTVHPGFSPCTLLLCSNDKLSKKRAHSGCTPPKIVHPAAEMCAPGAGCTLNFGHCGRYWALTVWPETFYSTCKTEKPLQHKVVDSHFWSLLLYKLSAFELVVITVNIILDEIYAFQKRSDFEWTTSFVFYKNKFNEWNTTWRS